MQIAIRRFLINVSVLIIFLLSFLTGFAQPPIEAEIPTEINPSQLDPKNLSQPQLRALLEDKNKETGRDKNAELYKNNRIEKDSLQYDDRRIPVYNPQKTYGADVFFFAPGTSLTELSTPPLDYPIGVGDHIIVSLWGAAEFQEDYVVARDGAIFPTSLGKISVQGLTFENMRAIVYSRFRSVVPPATNISVSLGQPRSINVNVVGEVNRAGIQTVSAFSNAFTVIARAGGINQFGNLRSIQIKRNGRVIDEIDVYKYLTTGDFGKHIYLQNNDFVIVGFQEKKVLATGQFKRPMFYQLKKEEGVKALIKYAGGLNAGALASGLKVFRTENEKSVISDVNANAILMIEGEDFMLQDGDIVKVDLVKPGISNKVEIRGEITYPDIFELRPGDRLFDLINRAGGVTRNTYLPRAYIFRGAGDSTNLRSDRLEVDLTGVNNNDVGSVSNVKLEPNDVIQLFSTQEFSDAQYVDIFGEVRKEGRVNKYGGMTLEDLLYLSGGIKQSAEFGRLEISSVVDIDSARQNLKPTRTVIRSYAIQPNLTLDSAAAKVLLRPYDQVFVRRNPTFELQQNIEIKGLIKYPGLYPRLTKYDRLSSFIERAGGTTDNANLEGAVLMRTKNEFFREKVLAKPVLFDSLGLPIIDSLSMAEQALDEPVSIDLEKALKYRNSKYDIVLQEGDVIIIPEINPFVSVLGSVQSPLKIAYDKEHTKLMYYIDKAGGFGIRPWRKRVFVTYANGKSKRTKTFMFMRFYPRVEEGSVVMVPIKPEGQEFGDTVKAVLITSVPVILTAIIFKYIN